MSKIAIMFESADLTQTHYDAIMSELKARDEIFNSQRISHASFNKDGKWCVIDVWESPEAMNNFVTATLLPIFQKLKIPALQPQVYPVHNYLGARQQEVISA